MASLSVNIHHLKLKNPVMTASGTFGYGLEFADFVPLDEIGGIIVKGTTLVLARAMTIPEWQRRHRECSTVWACRIRA